MTIAISPAVRIRVTTAFRDLNRKAIAQSFPKPAALATTLEKIIPNTGVGIVPINAQIAALFAAAAIDMWQRGVHSFLISVTLTKASPLWASVSGYYASHYSVRGIAHLLGIFQLFRKRKIVKYDIQAGHLICDFSLKRGSDREHKFYWKVVSDDPHFANDPLFPPNDDAAINSDSGHRNRGNYTDHVRSFPPFQTLNENDIKLRIDHISDISFDAPPIPVAHKFPDLESVQIVAYHRIVRFRQFLDEILGTKNHLWAAQRNPSWAHGILDFQIAEQSGIKALAR